MPIFISGHVILFQKAWGIGWSALPERISDAFTIVIITACMFLFLRRLIKREVRYLTTPSDFLILAIVFAPFITGFLAFHQFENYRLWLILHILSGEIMLMAIPFSRLSHMLYGPFTRAYLGSEFGGIRHAKDW
jgi:nitrate reductase gamma subunit